jgi:hypothetical protein
MAVVLAARSLARANPLREQDRVLIEGAKEQIEVARKILVDLAR